MYEISLFEDINPRSSRDTDKKLTSKLSDKKPSSIKGNTIRDKMELIQREVENHLSFLFDVTEECRSEERLSNCVDNFTQQDKGTVDTETLGVDYFNDKIFGFSLYAEGDKSIYIPVLHKGMVTGQLLDDQLEKSQIAKQLERIKNSNTKLLFHNGKFDLHMIYHNFGVMLPIYWDSMIASRLLHSSEKDHSLKYQYAVKVKGETGKSYNFKSLFDGVPPEMVPIKTMTPYAAGDTFETMALQEFQEKEFKKYPGIYKVFQLEMKLLPLLIEMEENGVSIDKEQLDYMTEKYTKKLQDAMNGCYKELEKYQDKLNRFNLQHPGKLSNPVNLSSPQQLSIILYDIIGMAELPKYKRGTGKEVIKVFKEKNEFCKRLAEVKEVEKLVNGFIKSIPKFIREDGKVHSDFVQVKGTGNTSEEDEESGADTGRFSCKDPNLQQIPGRGEKSELRKMFCASPGYVMFSSDYSQQEPRMLAHCSQDKEMLSAYREGKDLYALMASKIYHKTYEECLEFYPEGTKIIIDGKEVICGKKEHTNKEGKARRSATKAVLLGLMYGRGQASIAEQTGSTVEEAKELIDTFYNEFPNVRKWMTKVEEDCKKNGYVDTIFGRRRELPDAMLPEYAFKSRGGKPKGFNPLDFSMTASNELDFTVDEETQKYYINKLHKAFGWKAKDEIIQQAKAEGIEIKDNSQYVAKAMRQAVNSTIQGGSADMSKLAMLKCYENEELRRLGFRILFPVHDEIIAEAPKENAKRCGELMAQLMVEAAAEICPSVPYKCDVEYFVNWAGDSLDYNEETGEWYVKDSH